VFTVLAIVAAALVGILVASLLSNGRQNSQSEQNSGQTQNPAPTSTTTAAPSTTTTTAAPTTTTTPPSSPPSAHTPADFENAVRQYYALLPANPTAAWALLTPRAQQKSGNPGTFETYAQFWAGISSVQVLTARAEENRVAAVLRFVTADGKESTEAYVFMLIDQNGQLLIDNFTQAGRGLLIPGG
jgi:hypothetical protein